MSKVCPRCGANKPHAAFWRDRSRSDGLQSYCKPCLREANESARKKNPDATEFTTV